MDGKAKVEERLPEKEDFSNIRLWPFLIRVEQAQPTWWNY